MTDPSPAALADALRQELKARWQAGDRTPAEEYVARLPAPDPDAAVDLIFAEYLLREQAGDSPDADEYARRFPDHAAVLREQIALHHALETLAAPSNPSAMTRANGTPREFTSLPTRFGRYVLQRVLGRGGMGVVYLADDTELDRRVALKVMSLDHGNPLAVARFQREARTAAGLHHPSLCPVYDIGRIDGTDFLTMPYIPGDTLAARLRAAGPFPAGDAVRLVGRIAEAMQAAHDAGVIHRDLKPGNVMLGEQGDPIVTDFGLARRVVGDDARLTGSGTIIGTPAYMPPEQIGSGPEALGPACDVYSLGAILYELLTGRPPFQGTAGQVLVQVVEKTVDPPSSLRPGLPGWLDAVCAKALAKRPADRFGSMAEFAAALKSQAAPPPRTGAPRPRLPVLAAALAVVLVLGVGVAVWLTGFTGSGVATVPTSSATPPAPEDLLAAGSVWDGSFRFGDDGPARPVVLAVTDRTGSTFRGRYRTEGVYEWEVDGTIDNNAVHWRLTKAVTKDAENTGATGRAFVEGTLTGAEMKATFHDPGDGSRAAMTLRVKK